MLLKSTKLLGFPLGQCYLIAMLVDAPLEGDETFAGLSESGDVRERDVTSMVNEIERAVELTSCEKRERVKLCLNHIAHFIPHNCRLLPHNKN